MEKEISILAINPGSTSTKLALFHNDVSVLEQNIPFNSVERKPDFHILDEFDLRMNGILEFMSCAGLDIGDIDLVTARASTPAHVNYGAYEIDKFLVEAICYAREGNTHSSSLSPILAYALAAPYAKPAIFYDAVSADHTPPIARMSGLPGMNRMMGGHNLNTRMVGREAAATFGKKYEDCKFVIAHLGGGFSVSAHNKGTVVDSIMSDEGPMSPQRAGRVNFIQLFHMCFSGDYTEKDMQRITDSGGLLSYLGANDTIEVERRVTSGDEKAKFMYEVMAYQLSKAIGEMFVALKCDADAVIITGGLANSALFTGWVTEYVKRLANIMIIPGEREMLALARGGLRVVRGEEETQKFMTVPGGFGSLEALKENFVLRRPDLIDLIMSIGETRFSF